MKGFVIALMAVSSLVMAQDLSNVKMAKGCRKGDGKIFCEMNDGAYKIALDPVSKTEYSLFKTGSSGSSFNVKKCKEILPMPPQSDVVAYDALETGDMDTFDKHLSNAMKTGDYRWLCFESKNVKAVYCPAMKLESGLYPIQVNRYDELGILESEKVSTVGDKNYCMSLFDAL